MLWKPGRKWNFYFLGVIGSMILLFGYLHSLSGLSYEFHVFFSIPILATTWFIGLVAGCTMTVFVVSLWAGTDYVLGGTQAALLPLLFNTTARLLTFLFSVWLIAKVRALLDREQRLASEDPLTRLPNRRNFAERGRQALAQAHRAGSAITAVSFDLDKFKEVNDTLGHGEGDALLVCVADVLRRHLRQTDIPARLGGDEFALLLPGMSSAAAQVYVNDLYSQLMDAISKNHWPVTFSVGVASYARAPVDFDRMLADSDGLMYEVKRSGRNGILRKDYTSP